MAEPMLLGLSHRMRTIFVQAATESASQARACCVRACFIKILSMRVRRFYQATKRRWAHYSNKLCLTNQKKTNGAEKSSKSLNARFITQGADKGKPHATKQHHRFYYFTAIWQIVALSWSESSLAPIRAMHQKWHKQSILAYQLRLPPTRRLKYCGIG